MELALDGSCDFVADCTDTLFLLHPTNDNGHDIGRDLLPLFYNIEQHYQFDQHATEITKMIAITTALLNQLTPVEDLGNVIEEMFSVGMFRYKKRTDHINKVSNVLELLRKVDLISFNVQCPFCLYDCSCLETHFQCCGCFFPTESAVVDGTESELDSCDLDDAVEDMEIDQQQPACSEVNTKQSMVRSSMKPSGVPSRLLRIAKNCNHKKMSPLSNKRTYGDSFLTIFSSPSSGSPAKKGCPYLGRPPDPGLTQPQR